MRGHHSIQYFKNALQGLKQGQRRTGAQQHPQGRALQGKMPEGLVFFRYIRCHKPLLEKLISEKIAVGRGLAPALQ